MSLVMREWPRRHRISVEHYHRMAEAGLFGEDECVELINGEIIDVPPMGSRHAGRSTRLADLLSAEVAGRALVRQQMPISLSGDSEPQPDIAVVKPRNDYYESSHPTAADVFLLVEVSDATLGYDRDVKAALYARHEIPELWIVDLQGKQVHFYRVPANGNYTSVASSAEPGLVPIVSVPGAAIDLSRLAP